MICDDKPRTNGREKSMLPRILLSTIFVSVCCIPVYGQDLTRRANATIEFDTPTGHFKLGESSQVNAGNEAYARRLANSVLTDLNEYIDQVAGKHEIAEILNSNFLNQTYGHEGNQTYVIFSDNRKNVPARKAIDLGMMQGVRNTQIVGGNIFAKRAAVFSSGTRREEFGKHLMAGREYEKYIRNKLLIDAAMKTSENSPKIPSKFASNWKITFDYAAKLGIERSAISDFYGGPKGFVDSVLRLSARSVSYEDIEFRIDGKNLQVFDARQLKDETDMSQQPLFNEIGFLNLAGHPEGGAGFRQLKQSKFSHFMGPETAPGIEPSQILLGDDLKNTLHGGKGRDWLDGKAGSDILKGGGGNDVILGGLGNDNIYGGPGDDILFSGAGENQLWGNDGNDEFHSGPLGNKNMADGGSGNDVFFVKSDKNETGTSHVFQGGIGSDTLSFNYFREPVDITLGQVLSISAAGHLIQAYDFENLSGTPYADHLNGDLNNNVLKGMAGKDTINGSGGDDVIEGGAGGDILTGGDGRDTLSYLHSSGGVDVSIEIDAPHAFGGDASGDLFEDNFENLTGSLFADVLDGNRLDNIISGKRGDDYLIASNGADEYHGGPGFDTVDYGNHKGAGLVLDVENGISGYEDGKTTSTGRHKLSDIEHIVGTKGQDVIKFGNGNNVLEGGQEDDRLYGGQGDDIYFVEFNGGHDKIFERGNEGRDTIMIAGDQDVNWNDISFSLENGLLTISVKDQTIATAENGPHLGRTHREIGIEILDFANTAEINIEHLEADHNESPPTPSGDVIKGHDNRSNLILGLDGDDTLYGGTRADIVRDKGNLFHGGYGDDQIYSGAGDDKYIFDRGSGADTINDLGGSDHIYFGTGVSENSLAFEIRGDDFYIGIKPDRRNMTSNTKASEFDDRIRIVNGARNASNRIEFYTIQKNETNLAEIIKREIRAASPTQLTNPDPRALLSDGTKTGDISEWGLLTTAALIETLADVNAFGSAYRRSEDREFMIIQNVGVISAFAEHCGMPWEEHNFLPFMRWQRTRTDKHAKANVLAATHGIYQSTVTSWIKEHGVDCKKIRPVLVGNFFGHNF